MSLTVVEQDPTHPPTRSYRAAVVHAFGEPLTVEQVPVLGLNSLARCASMWRRPASATRTSTPLAATGP